ncbi:hypothetical protein FKW77_003847 [Venturia effusa]|uniref:Uncharacterized protein n=1 Tax=Venturia effusa TaxID=50376 RepID=A0A517L340_9PEZI|nr:hypothetical protein FKW77_003847 [Venturia effusa]
MPKRAGKVAKNKKPNKGKDAEAKDAPKLEARQDSGVSTPVEPLSDKSIDAHVSSISKAIAWMYSNDDSVLAGVASGPTASTAKQTPLETTEHVPQRQVRSFQGAIDFPVDSQPQPAVENLKASAEDSTNNSGGNGSQSKASHDAKASTASSSKDKASNASSSKDKAPIASSSKDQASTASSSKDKASTASSSKDKASNASSSKDKASTTSSTEDRGEILSDALVAFEEWLEKEDTAFILHIIPARYSREDRQRLTNWVKTIIKSKKFPEGEPRPMGGNIRTFVKKTFRPEDQQKIFTWAANAPGLRRSQIGNGQFMMFGPISVYTSELNPEIDGYVCAGWALADIMSLLDLSESYCFRPKKEEECVGFHE